MSTPASSNGRTPEFDSGNRGSNPCAGTIVLRTTPVPEPEKAAPRPASANPPIPPAVARMERNKATLIAHFEELARDGKPCPANIELGKLIGVSAQMIKRHYLRELKEEGRIECIVTLGWQPRRRIRVIASGLSTAERQIHRQRASFPTYPTTALEAAKTRLRQRGFVVFAATVDEGRFAGDFVKIDGRRFTPQEVIDRAAQLDCRGR